jgi:hypothetical protein
MMAGTGLSHGELEAEFAARRAAINATQKEPM